MKKIMIKSITQLGVKALKKQFEDYKHLNWQQKAFFRTAGYKLEIGAEIPFSLLFSINNARFENPPFYDAIIKEIRDSIEGNLLADKEGVKEGTDFKIEEVYQ